MSILFVTHNLGVVAEIAHRVAGDVRRAVVEDAESARSVRPPHPLRYTRGLLSCIPTAALLALRQRLQAILGNVPSVTALPLAAVLFALAARWPARTAPRPSSSWRRARPHLAALSPSVVPQRSTLLPRPAELLLNVQVLDGALSGGGRNAPPVRAVENVSFDVARNSIVGLAGESGSGKTTTGRALLRLFALTAGRIVFDGQ